MEPQFSPKRVGGALNGKRITDFQLGLESTAAVTREGEMYMWGNSGESEGSSGAGRLGLGHANVQPTPVKVEGALGERRVIQICAGSHHSGAVTDSGSVFMWGKGNYGQLGLGTKSESLLPCQVGGEIHAARTQHVVQICANGNHSAALLDTFSS
eukprot:TRINITY_DN50773_c0_g1_i1.p1 TRINITY_DN50773_c0_g1~~TRINITY_DN50773_c0_g1_i1.p1  ORF type:complete len:155 (+),score=24.48 TRINITY_DN50773_c0_g1_i1:203-667(+)